ncbi:MAG: hypothetical protein JWR09_1911 [Mucilaginibacter sp.]|nr:hypothetical protein [Mucilaginibacter sp.]
MKDVVGERVSQYLYQFYYPKNSDILLSELKKLVIKKDDDFKIDILYIERFLNDRGLSKELNQVYADIANDKKIIYKINFGGLVKRYKAIFLKDNIRMSIFSFGATAFFILLIYMVPENWSVVYGICFLLGVSPLFCALWIILEPLLTCIIIPLVQQALNIPTVILRGLIELIGAINGGLKKLSLFYDKEQDKPIIEKNNQLSSHEIMIIESLFEKTELTENQAKHYLDALLSVKRNISNNLL